MKIKRILLIILFALSFNSSIISQAQIDIPLIVSDGNEVFDLLRVGLDTTATVGIDQHLGEYDLPIIPPTDILRAAFDLTPYTGVPLATFRDYRNAPSFPFTGSKEHLLLWQLSSGGTALTIFYNFPLGITANIKDLLGGVIFNITISDSGNITIPDVGQAILTMYYDSVVPVEFTSFTASVLQNDKAVQIDWSTATETNNSGFEILRKAQNDNKWNDIGFVPGFGITTEPKSYSFIDEDITTGIYKYRLKQIDFDGSFEYSNEIEVEVDFTPKEFVLYQNYPNPFNPVTTINYDIPEDSFIELRIYDILGRVVAALVNEKMEAGKYSVNFDATSLSSGIYIYKIVADNFIASKKMILLK